MNDQIHAEPPHGEALFELLRAYVTTDYHVASPSGTLTFHVGEQNENNDILLIGAGVERWTVLTAWNPHSQLRSWEENEEAQVRLKGVIENRDFKWWEAAANHSSNTWPTEESCLVLNIVAKEALELCRMFGQLAVLYGETGDTPWLLFGNWREVGPRVQAVIPDSEVWHTMLAQTIERNTELLEQ